MATNLSWENGGRITLSLVEVKRIRLAPIQQANHQYARRLEILSEQGDYHIDLWAEDREFLTLVEELPH
jgi:hypothetical protein